MAKGFRVPPQPSKKVAQQQVQTELANTQMASKISQMMTQQLMESVRNMGKDLSAVTAQMMELEYKLGAIQKSLNISDETVTSIANVQRLSDFNHAATKADLRDNLVPATEIDVDSTIIICSDAKDAEGNDRSIFRSRIKLSESGAPDLINQLQGKKIGDVVESKLNGVEHKVEVLSIHNPSPEPAAPVAEPVQ